MPRISSILFVLTLPAFAQLDSNTIRYIASRTMVEPPDQIDFTVPVVMKPGVLDDVLTILQPAGITASNLTSVTANYQSPDDPGLQWTFDLTVPLSKAQDIAQALNALSKNSSQVHYTSSSAWSTTDLQDFLQCPTADLLAEARTQGQAMAALAGGTLGPVLALSDQSSDTTTVGSTFIPYAAFNLGTNPFPVGVISGSPATGIWFTSAYPATYRATYRATSTCNLTVKFSLIRYQ